jgi:hypothetical protein
VISNCLKYCFCGSASVVQTSFASGAVAKVVARSAVQCSFPGLSELSSPLNCIGCWKRLRWLFFSDCEGLHNQRARSRLDFGQHHRSLPAAAFVTARTVQRIRTAQPPPPAPSSIDRHHHSPQPARRRQHAPGTVLSTQTPTASSESRTSLSPSTSTSTTSTLAVASAAPAHHGRSWPAQPAHHQCVSPECTPAHETKKRH